MDFSDIEQVFVWIVNFLDDNAGFERGDLDPNVSPPCEIDPPLPTELLDLVIPSLRSDISRSSTGYLPMVRH